MSTPSERLHDRFRAVGITPSDFRENTAEVRKAFLEFGRHPGATYNLVRSVESYESGKEEAVLAKLVSPPDFLALQQHLRPDLPDIRYFNTKDIQDAMLAASNGQGGPLDDNLMGVVAFRAKADLPAALWPAVSPRLHKDLCTLDPLQQRPIEASLNSLRIAGPKCILEASTLMEENRWLFHQTMGHTMLTENTGEVYENYIQNGRVVWSEDRRVVCVPCDYGLKLRAVTQPGDANFIKDFSVGQFAQSGGTIMQAVDAGEFYARICYFAHNPSTGGTIKTPMFMQVPGHLARFLRFNKDEEGHIFSLKPARAFTESFHLAASVSISRDMKEAFIEVLENTENRLTGSRRKTLPAYETSILKRTLRHAESGNVRVQGHPFSTINSDLPYRPRGHDGFGFRVPACFEAKFTENGKPAGLSLIFPEDPDISYFSLANVENLHIRAGGDGFDLTAG